MNSLKTRFFKEKKIKSGEKRNKKLFAEVYSVVPAPSRDYCALQLYQKNFVWTRWKISHGPYENPIQNIISLEKFSKEVTMQNELTYIFGEDTTNLIREVANEKWSLTSMPSNVLQKIFSYVSVLDILRLSQVCKRLSKECSKNELWQTVCKKQWKILIHNDIEKAKLIGWKKVYLEKMRPKRNQRTYQSKPNILRNRVSSVSTLNTPNSQITTKSNLTIHKHLQELQKTNSLQSTCEVFEKDFKVTSTNIGKSTERTFTAKEKPFSRNSKLRPRSSGKVTTSYRSSVDKKNIYQSSHSVINLIPLIESPKECGLNRKNKSPRITKCKVTSVRTNSAISSPDQSKEFRSFKLKANINRPGTGKSMKNKN